MMMMMMTTSKLGGALVTLNPLTLNPKPSSKLGEALVGLANLEKQATAV